MDLDPYLTSFTNITSKYNKDLPVGAKTVKLFKENTGVKLHDPGFGSGFLDIITKAQATKEKIDKLDLVKIENLCATKDTIKK